MDGHHTAVSGAAQACPNLTLIRALGGGGMKSMQVLNWCGFVWYIGRVLGPHLRRGGVLVLDNLPAHQLSGLQQELARRGAEIVFLPPCSPGFTPVEQA